MFLKGAQEQIVAGLVSTHKMIFWMTTFFYTLLMNHINDFEESFKTSGQTNTVMHTHAHHLAIHPSFLCLAVDMSLSQQELAEKKFSSDHWLITWIK